MTTKQPRFSPDFRQECTELVLSVRIRALFTVYYHKSSHIIFHMVFYNQDLYVV